MIIITTIISRGRNNSRLILFMIGRVNIMDDRKKCVDDYLNGEDIEKLANKYSVSESTIYRWIKKANLNEFQIITAKIAKVIPINIQNEILQALSATPLRQGYDEIKWNTELLINYIKNKYNIEIDIKEVELLFKIKRMITEDEEEFDNILFDLDEYGYNIVFLDYFQIAKMESREIELIDSNVINTRSREFRSKGKEEVYLNLIIARANKHVYMDIIPSYEDISSKKDLIFVKFGERIVNNGDEKFINEINNFINIICKVSNKKCVFICKKNSAIYWQRKHFSQEFIYVKEEIYSQYLREYEENINLSTAIAKYRNSMKDKKVAKIDELNSIINSCLLKYLRISKGKVNRKESIIRLKEYRDKYVKVINSKYIYARYPNTKYYMNVIRKNEKDRNNKKYRE